MGQRRWRGAGGVAQVAWRGRCEVGGVALVAWRQGAWHGWRGAGGAPAPGSVVSTNLMPVCVSKKCSLYVLVRKEWNPTLRTLACGLATAARRAGGAGSGK